METAHAFHQRPHDPKSETVTLGLPLKFDDALPFLISILLLLGQLWLVGSLALDTDLSAA